jgi:TPR repeat protein
MGIEDRNSKASCDAGATRRAWLLGALGGLVLVQPFGAALAQTADPAPCDTTDPKCAERMKVRDAADLARKYLNLGDAEAAADNIIRAREYWEDSIDAGFETGAQAAIIAQKRMKMYTLTCSYNDKSLAALSQAMNGKLVNIPVIQDNLKALGYYQGPINGQLTELTRSAFRKFQRDMAFDETDNLRPRQVVYLICNGAETARDNASLTTLALMYATGIGVVHSRNFALALLRKASDREHGPATFFLAIIHGTGHCNFPHSLAHADQYLKEACQQKHLLALALVHDYGNIIDQTARWAKIGADPRVKECLSMIPCPSSPKKSGG